MASHESPQYLVDQALSRRLECAEASANASFVEARARVFPKSGACWINVAGAYAMFDGVGSPCTQTFGLGLFDPVGNDEMEKLERFFHDRGAEVFHEISPIADSSLLTLLNERGYKPCELSSVLFRPIERGLRLSRALGDSIRVRVIETGDEELWAKVVARGWQEEAPELAQYLEDLAPIEAQRADTYSFLAEKETEPIAAAAICVFEGVALLAGACTVPQYRRQGAQLALLERRLQFGAEQGCDLAMMAAAPGSASQRNAERQGFRIAYTRMKWRLGRETGKN